MKNIVNRTLVVKKTIFNIMKNIRNSRSLGLIVLALLFGSLQVWGDTETYTYSDYEGEGTSSTGSDYTMTKTYSSIPNSMVIHPMHNSMLEALPLSLHYQVQQLQVLF